MLFVGFALYRKGWKRHPERHPTAGPMAIVQGSQMFSQEWMDHGSSRSLRSNLALSFRKCYIQLYSFLAPHGVWYLWSPPLACKMSFGNLGCVCKQCLFMLFVGFALYRKGWKTEQKTFQPPVRWQFFREAKCFLRNGWTQQLQLSATAPAKLCDRMHVIS